MITRRGFLGSILALGAAPAIVRIGSLMPVREIWTPIPGVYILKPEQLLSVDMITNEAIRTLRGNLSFVRAINAQYGQNIKLGDTIRIRVPERYKRRSA